MIIGLAKHHITLTDNEADILSNIDLRINHPNHDERHQAYIANQEPIMELLRSLSKRSGIPEKRLKYWNDPQYQLGRLRGSHRDIFARNGSTGKEAYTHPHFLPFLRFFLFGADLPSSAMIEFEKQIGMPELFSSSDITRLTKATRAIVRQYNLRDYDHADEFHKLAIDNNLNHFTAARIRKAATDAAR